MNSLRICSVRNFWNLPVWGRSLVSHRYLLETATVVWSEDILQPRYVRRQQKEPERTRRTVWNGGSDAAEWLVRKGQSRGAVASRPVSSSKSSGIPWNRISGRAVARPRVGRFLLSSWPLEMDVRMRIHRQGGVRGPSEGLRLAHYQQLWPNGTLRRATRLHRPPPTSGTPAEPSPTARSCPRLPYDNGI